MVSVPNGVWAGVSLYRAELRHRLTARGSYLSSVQRGAMGNRARRAQRKSKYRPGSKIRGRKELYDGSGTRKRIRERMAVRSHEQDQPALQRGGMDGSGRSCGAAS